MTVDSAIAKAFLHAKRKATSPTGSKYNALLGMADSFQKLWATETDWSSLYASVTLTALVSATDTFSLANATGTVDYISDREGNPIQLYDGTSYAKVYFVSPAQLYEYRFRLATAQIGSNLKFSAAFAADSQYIGDSIVVPAYLAVNEITSGSDTVQVDDPMWLCYMMAAEFCRNDVEKAGQYDNLLALADQCMQKMLANNGGQYETVVTAWQPEGESWV